MIGVGVVTYRRPELFRRCLEGLIEHVVPTGALIVAVNDGTDPDYPTDLYELMDHHGIIPIWQENSGVAKAKNRLLETMMWKGCDHLFLAEDDVAVTSPQAILGYIEAGRRTGIAHFNWAHHGPANRSGPIDSADGIDYYPNAVGAWSYYTAKAIEAVGFFDEQFRNAWEHCEHTDRVAKAGFTTPFWRFADVTGSEEWLIDLDPSLTDSVIRSQPGWIAATREGLAYWRAKDPEGPFSR